LFDIVLASTDLAEKSRMFGLDDQALLAIGFQLLNVGLLAFILSKLLYKPVREFMAKRSEKISSQIEGAMAESDRAVQLRLEYEQKLKDAGRERDAILDEARRQAAETGRVMLAEAKTEADAIKARAQAGADMEWERIQADMKRAILEVSAAMAEKMVMGAASVSADVHEKLFNQTMAELEGTSWRN
jgi:F-type H+-transporting ATPase subunit b